MNNTPMKAHILALLHFTRQQELHLIANLSDPERNATGTPNTGITKGMWAAKDFVANMLHWKELQTQKLATVQRGEVPPDWTDMKVVHQINVETFTRYRTSAFQAIEEEAEHVFNAFITQVERMSEEELNDPRYYAWLEGTRLRNEVLNYGFWYPCNQLTICAFQLGKKQLAFQLQEALVEAVRQSALPDEGVGVAIYNMVCFYATNGKPEKALQHLPEALRLRPTLFEVSKRDSDLESLRTNPTFQAILTDPALLARVPLNVLVKPHDLHTSLRGEVPPLVIDVRGSAEYAVGHVEGAVNIPLGNLESQLSQIPHERPVVTYCNMHHQGASRGELAATKLREHGYRVSTLDGGYPNWKAQGFLIEAAPQE
ncbi:rhodanese-like domain-containing protein [Ktedonospora formicarum]|uniref:Rhodanese domain-containing protein n=1 Tax=Ktedonospora formicarum TaxID=2778364 RepID=A0A8J3MWM2_9CHLR|nr:rhodanese-like domain-containing protein [Ktedonospora formicarum]GHO50485.1 hypothetical protein KSX_86480 [Ktedonospora formicarum]